MIAISRIATFVLTVCALLLASATALAQPVYIFHGPTNQVFGEGAGITMREPDAAREDEPVDLWIEVGYSFDYSQIGIYYTTDGSTPNGGFGTGDVGTLVLSSQNGGVSFVRNQFDSGANRNRDWWRRTHPRLGPSLRPNHQVQDRHLGRPQRRLQQVYERRQHLGRGEHF